MVVLLQDLDLYLLGEGTHRRLWEVLGAVVQDDQVIGEENEPTSLLVRMPDIGVRKARVSAAWLELADWSAAMRLRTLLKQLA